LDSLQQAYKKKHTKHNQGNFDKYLFENTENLKTGHLGKQF